MGANPAPDPGDRRIDYATGLPGLPAALAVLARSAQQLVASQCIGIINFAALPDPALLRLTTEADRKLRAEITQRLAGALRPQDQLYSAGQWEWLVILADLPSSVPLMLAMMRLDTLFADPLPSLDGGFLTLRVACGGAMCPDDGADPRHLVQSSRIACLTLLGLRNAIGNSLVKSATSNSRLPDTVPP